MLTKILGLVPRALSSKPSIVIFIGLFIYLVGFGLIGLFAKSLEPSDTMQLVLGNYTNVTSATGASIAAGAGLTTVATTAAVLTHVKRGSQKYDELKKSHDEMSILVKEMHHALHASPKPSDSEA
jgi:amino acid permease